MTGILSYDFFAMRKKISAYVCLLLPVVFVILYAVFASSEEYECTMPEMFSMGQIPLVMCMTVFYALYSGHDLKKGYIKNIAGSLPNRISYVLSKAALLIAYTLVSVGTMLLTALAFAKGRMEGIGSETGSSDFDRYVGLLTLLLIAVMVTVLFLRVLTGNMTGTIVFAVLYGTGLLANLFYSLLSLLMYKLKWKFDFENISLSLRLQSLSVQMDDKDIRATLLIGIAYILIFGTLSCVLFRRKDIA